MKKLYNRDLEMLHPMGPYLEIAYVAAKLSQKSENSLKRTGIEIRRQPPIRKAIESMDGIPNLPDFLLHH